ncbi:hypothetical protein F5884DRAFT_871522, partial [Xylogone sp. PMI_703]
YLLYGTGQFLYFCCCSAIYWVACTWGLIFGVIEDKWVHEIRRAATRNVRWALSRVLRVLCCAVLTSEETDFGRSCDTAKFSLLSNSICTSLPGVGLARTINCEENFPTAQPRAPKSQQPAMLDQKRSSACVSLPADTMCGLHGWLFGSGLWGAMGTRAQEHGASRILLLCLLLF